MLKQKTNRKIIKYKSESSTIERIFEINENYEKDESGKIPVIIKVEPEEKRKRSLN
tara:strand:+ start:1926 stop:2093 length:168 start_codon:yes stop_codon:yes gene_type:complete